MKTKVQFCPSCSQYPAEARLVRVLERMGWQLTVDFDEETPAGAFAVYLNQEMMVFSDIAPVIPTRAPGDPAENEAGHGPF